MNPARTISSKLRLFCGVALDRLRVFLVCRWMKDVRLHRPIIFRIRADTSSPGMP